MNLVRYLFPGFVLGPLGANFLAGAVSNQLMASPELSSLSLFLIGLGTSVAFWAMDRMGRH